jgi:hypothetical protein
VDREVRKTFEETAPVRKSWESVEAVAKPFAPMLAARGMAVPQALESYLRTDALLTQGTPEQKAHTFAQLVRTYGMANESGLEAINRFLGQSSPAPASPFVQQQPAVDPNVIAAQVRAQIEQEQRNKQLSTFYDSHEFAMDLDGDMAAIVSAGRTRDPEEAYKLALRMHELDEASEIGAILRQRKAAKAAEGQQASAAAKRSAGTSVKSQPTVVASAPPKGIRAALEAAMAKGGK